jgi:hypothetical protein
MSRQITCFNDLHEHGIIFLTGESDALGFRVLCDFTKKGHAILSKVFGGIQFRAPENWNRGPQDDPHVGAILLSSDMLPTIGIIALLECGCSDVYVFHRDVTADAPGRLFNNGVPHGFFPDEREVRDSTLKLAASYGWHARHFSYKLTGDRNQHAFSGRTE